MKGATANRKHQANVSDSREAGNGPHSALGPQGYRGQLPLVSWTTLTEDQAEDTKVRAGI